MKQAVSLIIPTLNAESFLPELFRALQRQTVPFEILIIDSSSTDDTVRFAQSFGAKTLVIKQEDFDHGGTRNLAIGRVKGDIIVFLTQDSVPTNARAVENLILSFDDARIGAAYGRQLPRQDADPFAAHMRLFKYPAQSCVKSAKDKNLYGIDTPALSNSFAAYRKIALEKIGLFKNGTLFAEDVQAGAKLLLSGYHLAYVAEACVYHSHNHSMIEECKRYFDNGVFYQIEKWIRNEFGGNQGEGWRYVRSEFRYLLQNGYYHLFPQAVLRDFFRLAGYGLGLNHRILPRTFCRTMSTNKTWWDKDKKHSAHR